MENKFLSLKEKVSDMTISELQNVCIDFVDEIIKVDNRLLSVNKKWSGYGTWKSTGFANEYQFGKDLSTTIVKALNGKITHDEDKEFTIEEFRDDIYDLLLEEI